MRALILTIVLFSILPALCGAEVPSAAVPHRQEVARWTKVYLPAAKASWVAGQIHQESRWKVSARSPVGAMGLMQIMPATARDIARTCHLSGFNPSLPRHAIRGGICYDAWVWNFVASRLPRWTRTVEDAWWLTTRGYNGGIGYLLKEATALRSLELEEGPAVWLGSLCREFRAEASCHENLDYPVKIRQWAALYAGWD